MDLHGPRWHVVLCFGLVSLHSSPLHDGPYLSDTGWYSNAIFQNGFFPPNLPYLRPVLGDSLFTPAHLRRRQSRVAGELPVQDALPRFATVIGITYHWFPWTLLLAVMGPSRRHGRSVALACLAFGAGLVFAFSGPVVSAIGYPHFEAAIPSLFILFLALHFLGWSRAKMGRTLPWVDRSGGRGTALCRLFHADSTPSVVVETPTDCERDVAARDGTLRSRWRSDVSRSKSFLSLGASMFYCPCRQSAVCARPLCGNRDASQYVS